MEFGFYDGAHDRARAVTTPLITIQKKGIIRFNRIAVCDLAIESWKYVKLGWNQQERCIALRRVEEDGPGCRRMRPVNPSGVSVSCRPFFLFSPGLNEPHHVYYCESVEKTEAGDMILIRLGDDYPKGE